MKDLLPCSIRNRSMTALSLLTTLRRAFPVSSSSWAQVCASSFAPSGPTPGSNRILTSYFQSSVSSELPQLRRKLIFWISVVVPMNVILFSPFAPSARPAEAAGAPQATLVALPPPWRRLPHGPSPTSSSPVSRPCCPSPPTTVGIGIGWKMFLKLKKKIMKNFLNV